MLSKDKNEQARIVWDLLYKCELKATVGGWAEEQKAAYLKSKLPGLKSTKKYAYKNIKKVAESGRISAYVDGVSRELTLKE